MPRDGAGSCVNSFFWGTSALFSMVAAPVYISTNRIGGFPFSICHSQHLLFNILFTQHVCDVRERNYMVSRESIPRKTEHSSGRVCLQHSSALLTETVKVAYGITRVWTKSLTTAFPALWKSVSGSKCPYKPQWQAGLMEVSSDWKNKPGFAFVHHVSGSVACQVPFLKGWVGHTGSHLWYLGSLVAAWAQLPHSTWDRSRSGFEPVSPALADEFFTTGPPEKPQVPSLRL